MSAQPLNIESLRVGKGACPRPTFIAISDGEPGVAPEVLALIAHDAPTARCPMCRNDLPLSDFGVCCARKTGRNLYCKSCIRQKVTASRRALRAYRQAKRERKSQQDLPLIGAVPSRRGVTRRDSNGILVGDEIRSPKHAHHERVLGAIHQGARSQIEILKAIRPTKSIGSNEVESPSKSVMLDQIGDSLALLLDDPKQIDTKVISEERRKVVRIYFPAAPVHKPSVVAPRSFSNLGGIVAPLMKGAAA